MSILETSLQPPKYRSGCQTLSSYSSADLPNAWSRMCSIYGLELTWFGNNEGTLAIKIHTEIGNSMR